MKCKNMIKIDLVVQLTSHDELILRCFTQSSPNFFYIGLYLEIAFIMNMLLDHRQQETLLMGSPAVSQGRVSPIICLKQDKLRMLPASLSAPDEASAIGDCQRIHYTGVGSSSQMATTVVFGWIMHWKQHRTKIWRDHRPYNAEPGISKVVCRPTYHCYVCCRIQVGYKYQTA